MSAVIGTLRHSSWHARPVFAVLPRLNARALISKSQASSTSSPSLCLGKSFGRAFSDESLKEHHSKWSRDSQQEHSHSNSIFAHLDQFSRKPHFLYGGWSDFNFNGDQNPDPTKKGHDHYNPFNHHHFNFNHHHACHRHVWEHIRKLKSFAEKRDCRFTMQVNRWHRMWERKMQQMERHCRARKKRQPVYLDFHTIRSRWERQMHANWKQAPSWYKSLHEYHHHHHHNHHHGSGGRHHYDGSHQHHYARFGRHHSAPNISFRTLGFMIWHLHKRLVHKSCKHTSHPATDLYSDFLKLMQMMHRMSIYAKNSPMSSHARCNYEKKCAMIYMASLRLFSVMRRLYAYRYQRHQKANYFVKSHRQDHRKHRKNHCNNFEKLHGRRFRNRMLGRIKVRRRRPVTLNEVRRHCDSRNEPDHGKFENPLLEQTINLPPSAQPRLTISGSRTMGSLRSNQYSRPGSSFVGSSVQQHMLPPHLFQPPMQLRAFSTTSINSIPHPSIFLASAGLSYFKSASAIKFLSAISRACLSFFPFVLRKILFTSNASSLIVRLGWLTILLPVLLCAVTLLASIERTPISGRLRALLISENEEQDIVSSVIQPTRSMSNYGDEARESWLRVLRHLLHEDNAPVGTLLGGKVLDPVSDWRVGWCMLTLSALEMKLGMLVDPKSDDDTPVKSTWHPPPMTNTFKPRGGDFEVGKENLNGTRYSLLVVDRPEKNAFSFGFAPHTRLNEDGDVASAPGVIVVFTGFLDNILGRGSRVDEDGGSHHPTAAQVLSWKEQLRRSISPSRSKPEVNVQSSPPPNVLPSREQTEKLATLLSHELSHLLLSHTMETYAGSGLMWQQVERMTVDIFRTVTYPVTAILGPFVNDAIGHVLTAPVVKSGNSSGGGSGINEEAGSTLLATLQGSCSNRLLELEADRVGIRLLANADIDPRTALKFWEERIDEEEKNDRSLLTSSQEEDFAAETSRMTPALADGLNAHSARDNQTQEKEYSAASSILRSHPVDRERVEAIREELGRWEAYRRKYSTI